MCKTGVSQAGVKLEKSLNFKAITAYKQLWSAIQKDDESLNGVPRQYLPESPKSEEFQRVLDAA